MNHGVQRSLKMLIPAIHRAAASRILLTGSEGSLSVRRKERRSSRHCCRSPQQQKASSPVHSSCPLWERGSQPPVLLQVLHLQSNLEPAADVMMELHMRAARASALRLLPRKTWEVKFFSFSRKTRYSQNSDAVQVIKGLNE